MSNYKVKRNFNKYSDPKLLQRSINVADKMTGNINFLNPVPQLTEITTATNDFSEAYYQVYNGNLTYLPQKRKTRAKLIALLIREGIYVEYVGKGVESILASSGFEIYKPVYPRSPGSDVTVIRKARDTGIEGTIKLNLKKVKYAVVYEIRYTEDEILATANWVHLVCQTKTLFEISNLVPGVEYCFEARTISTKGASGWSNTFRIRVR